jgi:hypothetical protein
MPNPNPDQLEGKLQRWRAGTLRIILAESLKIFFILQKKFTCRAGGTPSPILHEQSERQYEADFFGSITLLSKALEAEKK